MPSELSIFRYSLWLQAVILLNKLFLPRDKISWGQTRIKKINQFIVLCKEKTWIWTSY